MSEWVGGNYYLSEMEMQNNATIIYNYFTEKGWSINAICAMLGNMQSESTINPNIWEGLTENIEKGYGLVQWTPSYKYTEWAGGDYANGYKQCERIQYEADNGLQWFYNAELEISPPITFKDFTTSTLDLKTLANYFLWFYEHPADPTQPQRGTQAENWYTYLTGVTPPKPTTKRKLPIWMYPRFF